MDDRDRFIESLYEDLQTEFQSVVQYVQHTAAITGPEYPTTVDELKVHLGQELRHAQILAEQIAFLGGTPTTTVAAVPAWVDSKTALEPTSSSRRASSIATGPASRRPTTRPRRRGRGAPPPAQQTQEHVRHLKGALGK